MKLTLLAALAVTVLLFMGQEAFAQDDIGQKGGWSVGITVPNGGQGGQGGMGTPLTMYRQVVEQHKRQTYKTVCEDASRIDPLVNDLLAQGYELYGTPYARGTYHVCQALVKTNI